MSLVIKLIKLVYIIFNLIIKIRNNHYVETFSPYMKLI